MSTIISQFEGTYDELKERLKPARDENGVANNVSIYHSIVTDVPKHLHDIYDVVNDLKIGNDSDVSGNTFYSIGHTPHAKEKQNFIERIVQYVKNKFNSGDE